MPSVKQNKDFAFAVILTVIICFFVWLLFSLLYSIRFAMTLLLGSLGIGSVVLIIWAVACKVSDKQNLDVERNIL